MSVGSPTAYLLWAILACLFFGFMIFHLWSYDKFMCLRWDAGRQPGAFKRVMTYSYLLSVPFIMVFAVALTALKFKEGFMVLQNGHVIPKLIPLWQDKHVKWVLPLYFVFSIGWAFEIVTHLEELTFWVFLLNQGPGKTPWFESWEFRMWYIGSLTAMLGMPLVTLITRNELESSLAWIFLVGSSAGTGTTICFLYVLARFPGFLRHVKREGAEPDVVVRLATFYQLNLARVCFRFLFTVPLFILALDGIQGRHRIVKDPFWSDFLLMLGSIGCVVSSAITLLIFFPRSITKESGYKAKNPSTHPSTISKVPVPDAQVYSPAVSPRHSLYHHHSSPSRAAMAAFRYPAFIGSTEESPEYDEENTVHAHYSGAPIPGTPGEYPSEPSWPIDGTPSDPPELYPYPEIAYTRDRYSRQNTAIPPPRTPPTHDVSVPTLHPYVMNFTSPIDLPEDEFSNGY